MLRTIGSMIFPGGDPAYIPAGPSAVRVNASRIAAGQKPGQDSARASGRCAPSFVSGEWPWLVRRAAPFRLKRSWPQPLKEQTVEVRNNDSTPPPAQGGKSQDQEHQDQNRRGNPEPPASAPVPGSPLHPFLYGCTLTTSATPKTPRSSSATSENLRVEAGASPYVQRRRAEGKTDREIRRCIRRYLARRLYRSSQPP